MINTAMQELRQRLLNRWRGGKATDTTISAMNKVLKAVADEIESEFLQKEKDQICQAYDMGKEQPSNSQLCPIDYFTQTYNQ